MNNEDKILALLEAHSAKFDTIETKIETVDTRFEAIDTKIEAIDTKIEAIDARFEAIDAKFEAIDARFDAVDAKFEAVDTRFEAVDARFDKLEQDLATVKKSVLRTELEQYPRIQVALDGIVAALERIESQGKRLDSLETTVDRHDVEIKVLQKQVVS